MIALRRPWLPFLGACASVVALSALAYTHHVPAVVSSHGFDKVLHATMGAVLTLLLSHVLRGRALVAALSVLAVLAADEYCQRFSSARSSDWLDLAADTFGAASIVVLKWRIRKDPRVPA